MKIQLINYTGNNEKDYQISECNSFGSPKSLDMFDINIIDLSDENIWKNYSYNKVFTELSVDNDFFTLKNNITDSNISKIIYILPMNFYFKTEYKFDYGRDYNRYYTQKLLKDLGDGLSYNLRKIIYPYEFDISYERTDTTIEKQTLSGDFYFSRGDSYEIENPIFSNVSKKLVTFSIDRFTFSCLQLVNNEDLQAFLSAIYPKENAEQNAPEWFSNVNFFDDTVQKTIVSNGKDAIIKANKKIAEAEQTLEKNNHYKSILYKTGQELEDVLVEMLSEMFDVDEEFVDNKDEDYSFKKGNIHYIFEFKGLTKDIKKSNISQLRTHTEKYSEDNDISEDNIKRILVATRFKDKEPSQRTAVSFNVIEVAKNPLNSVLIIDTVQFLKLFEKYKSGILNSKECLELLERVGLLEIGE